MSSNTDTNTCSLPRFLRVKRALKRSFNGRWESLSTLPMWRKFSSGTLSFMLASSSPGTPCNKMNELTFFTYILHFV